MSRRFQAAFASAFVAGAVAASLTLLESPGTARLRKADDVRAGDVEAIRNAVRHYVETEGKLPESLDPAVATSDLTPDRLRDPVTGEAYGYRRLDDTHLEVCATFSKDSRDEAYAQPRRVGGPGDDDAFWMHGTGTQCFRFASTWPK